MARDGRMLMPRSGGVTPTRAGRPPATTNSGTDPRERNPCIKTRAAQGAECAGAIPRQSGSRRQRSFEIQNRLSRLGRQPLRHPPNQPADLVHLVQSPWGRQLPLSIQAKAVPPKRRSREGGPISRPRRASAGLSHSSLSIQAKAAPPSRHHRGKASPRRRRSLTGMVLPLRVPLQLLAVEVHLPQVSRGIPLRLVVEVR